MPIVQVKMRVPQEQMTKVLNGSSELMGLVKNSVTKRVEKHIPIVSVESGSDSVVQIAISLAAVGAIIGVTFVGVKIYQISTRKRVKVFKKMLEKYVQAINDESLSENMIDELLASMDALTKKKSKLVKVEFSTEEMQALVSCLLVYTKELASANSFKIAPGKLGGKNDDALAQIRQSLIVQKDIFRRAA